jgi:hypothetical protein
MGVNSIRLTHYQHGPVIHDLADRNGLVVWDEVPLVSAWTVGGKLEPEAALLANAHQQLSELIRQNYNHPATAIWSIANEVDFGNSMPAFIVGGSGGKRRPIRCPCWRNCKNRPRMKIPRAQPLWPPVAKGGCSVRMWPFPKSRLRRILAGRTAISAGILERRATLARCSINCMPNARNSLCR